MNDDDDDDDDDNPYVDEDGYAVDDDDLDVRSFVRSFVLSFFRTDIFCMGGKLCARS